MFNYNLKYYSDHYKINLFFIVNNKVLKHLKNTKLHKLYLKFIIKNFLKINKLKNIYSNNY